ncbi:hypothetical protein BJ170DRAFT_596391 [Xylariales sp. AK1849]|nr:hypothetical protein BJ170DRAFT_596391 [Xylariales sp. AK1849]
MDSPNSARGRGRFSSRKRHTFPASSSSHRRSQSSEHPSSNTPAASVAQPSSSFTFETPSPSTVRGARTRNRNLDGVAPSPEEAGSKGGRSLRKRTRIDYSFDQADEEDGSIEAKSTPSITTRSLKKRKTDIALLDEDVDEELEPLMKRRASEQPPKSTSRRQTARKSTVEPQSFVTEQQEEDVAVQDTIEVGGHRSQHTSESSFHQRTSSDSSHKESVLPSQPSTQDITQETQETQESNVAAPVSITITDVTGVTDEPEYVVNLEAKLEVPKEEAVPKIEVQEEAPVVKHSEEQYYPARPSVRISEEDPAQVPGLVNDVTDPDPADPYARFTPYINGATVFYPALQTEAHEAETEPDMVPEEPVAEESTEDHHDVADVDTPVVTPVASPRAIDDTAVNSPAPDIEMPDAPLIFLKKQYPFYKTRSAQDFVDLFADMDNMSPYELQTRLEVATTALSAWQTEFNELRKVVDDEDNAARYQQEEAAFVHREKMALSKDPNANPIRKDFVVKGIRASKPNPMMAYARQQDKIMANAYGFDYDDRDAKIGQQDPLGQREGVGKSRLRDRPKQTAKAAEADDGPVVHGKRARKGPALFGEPEPVSRGTTPVPVQPRRRRGRPTLAEENGDAYLPLPAYHPEPALDETPPKKRGKGGRPRKHPLPVPIPEDNSVPEAGPEHEERQPRKRRRRSRKYDELDEEHVENGAFEHEQAQTRPSRRRNSRITEIPTDSFYSTNSMASTLPNDESRPATSSSTATISTTVSAYGLREKRQKHFSLDDEDDDFEDEESEQPKPKRIRRAPKKVQEQDFANIPSSLIPPDPDNVSPPKVPKIRVKGFNPNGASAPRPTSDPSTLPPVNGSNEEIPSTIMRNGDGPPRLPNGEVDYSQMTKSEKMSYSMKARWSSGSMSGAVAKRRATLAAKKAAALTPAPEGAPEASAEQ